MMNLQVYGILSDILDTSIVHLPVLTVSNYLERKMLPLEQQKRAIEFEKLSKPLDTLNLYANFIIWLVVINAIVIFAIRFIKSSSLKSYNKTIFLFNLKQINSSIFVV